MNADDIAGLDLNLLKVFEALYEEGGASRAALRLGLTQSAVSAALARLRVIYADPLFVRTGRGLAPTPRADELKPILSDALDRCRESLAIAADGGDRLGRTISIGLSDDFEIALGRALIDAVAREAAGIRLIFRQTHNGIAGDALLRHGVDLAIASGGFGERAQPARGRDGWLRVPDRPGRPRAAAAHADARRFPAARPPARIVGRRDRDRRRGAGHARPQAARRGVDHAFRRVAVPALRLRCDRDDSRARGARDRAIHPLRALACPVDLPHYPVEIGWRTSTQRDPAIVRVRDSIAACVAHLVAP